MLLTSINEKLHGIMQSNVLDELPLKYLPPVSDTPDNYYFVSYSHKDYKSVYADIYALQAEGVNIWYDRAMPAGQSWKETAEKYIQPSRCAGVVFYVSENSLLSPAIHEEIAFAQKCGKSCLTINLPMNDGKTYSAKEMLDNLITNGVDVPNDKYDFISQAFNNDVLYLPYFSSAEHKADKILNLKKPPLFEFEVLENTVNNNVVLTAVNDIELSSFKYLDCDVTDYKTGKQMCLTNIGRCAFANCRNLQTVELKDGVISLAANAFYGCKSLTSIELPDSIKFLEENVFDECINLKTVKLSGGIKAIPYYMFNKCTNLVDINLPVSVASIGEGAFLACEKLENIFFPDNLMSIDERAFCGCKSLRKAIIPDSVIAIAGSAFAYCKTLCEVKLPNRLTAIKNRTFSNCVNLKNVIIPDKVASIERGAFERCTNLISVTIGSGLLTIEAFAFAYCGAAYEVEFKFKGTVAQWHKIKKSNDWYVESGIKFVQCEDGVIELKPFKYDFGPLISYKIDN